MMRGPLMHTVVSRGGGQEEQENTPESHTAVVDRDPGQTEESTANARTTAGSFYKSTVGSQQQRTFQQEQERGIEEGRRAHLAVAESSAQKRNGPSHSNILQPEITGGIVLDDISFRSRGLSSGLGLASAETTMRASYRSSSSLESRHDDTLASTTMLRSAGVPGSGSMAEEFSTHGSLKQPEMPATRLEGARLVEGTYHDRSLEQSYGHQQRLLSGTGIVGSSLHSDNRVQQRNFLAPAASMIGSRRAATMNNGEEERHAELQLLLLQRSYSSLTNQRGQAGSLQYQREGGTLRVTREAEGCYRNQMEEAPTFQHQASRHPSSLLGHFPTSLTPTRVGIFATPGTLGYVSATPYYNFPAPDHGFGSLHSIQQPSGRIIGDVELPIGPGVLGSNVGRPQQTARLFHVANMGREMRDFTENSAALSTPSTGMPTKNPVHGSKRRTMVGHCEPLPKRAKRTRQDNKKSQQGATVVLGGDVHQSRDSLGHHTQRSVISLATSEDGNWLSEFMCYVRSDLTEVFQAKENDVISRRNSKKVLLGQVGIRCRHCAHVPYEERTSRSSCYPSSLSRIYQSLTMMIREHFSKCLQMDPDAKERFLTLKGLSTQGAADSKHFWVSSAKAIGMRDTDKCGIAMDSGDASEFQHLFGRRRTGMPIMPPPRTVDADQQHRRNPDQAGLLVPSQDKAREELCLVEESDRPYASELTFKLLSHTVRITMTQGDRVGNRKTMEAGARGFACKFCHAQGRLGQCRFFPTRKRTMIEKVKKDLYDHLQRCILCPREVQQELQQLRTRRDDESRSASPSPEQQQEKEKLFFHQVWTRLMMAPSNDE